MSFASSASAARGNSSQTANQYQSKTNCTPWQQDCQNSAAGLSTSVRSVAGHFAQGKNQHLHNDTSMVSSQSRDPAAMLSYASSTVSGSSDSSAFLNRQTKYPQQQHHQPPSHHREPPTERQRSAGKHPRQTSADVDNMFEELKLRSQSRPSGLQDDTTNDLRNGQTPTRHTCDDDDEAYEISLGAPPIHRDASPEARQMNRNKPRHQPAPTTNSATNPIFSDPIRASQSSCYSGALGGRSSSTFLMARGLCGHSISQTQLGEHSVSQEEVAYFNSKLVTEYREIKELGKGHFGRVVLVEELSTGQYFAVKISSEMIGARDEARLKHERNIMYALRGSPHCVNLHNSWVEGGTKKSQLYLQMHWCECGSVGSVAKDRRDRNILWKEEEVLVFLAHVGLALDAMHAVNIVHVDVKPENVLIDASGNYYLGDFGLALTLDDNTERPLSLTHNYLLTESQSGMPSQQPTQLTLNNPNLQVLSQLNGNSLTQSMASQDEGDCRYIPHDMLNRKEHYKAGDIFALGISMYELMSGAEVPARGPELHHLRNRTDLHELIQRGYSKALVDLVLSMISPDPNARPTARQLLDFRLIQPSHDTLKILSSAASNLQSHIPTILPAACAQSVFNSYSGSSDLLAPSSGLSLPVGDQASPSVNLPQGGNNTTHSYFSPGAMVGSDGGMCSTPKQGPISHNNGCGTQLVTRQPFAETPSSGSGSSSSPSFSPVAKLHGNMTTESVVGANPFFGGSGVIGQPDPQTLEAQKLRQLLTPEQLVSVRYHKACLEVAAVVFDLLNKAMCGIVPPARARYIQWQIAKQQQKAANAGTSTTWNISPSFRPGTSTPQNASLRRPPTAALPTNLLNITTVYPPSYHDPNKTFLDQAENSIMAAAELSTPIGNSIAQGTSAYVGYGQQFQTPHRK
eukprot:GILI01018457.1.p1 GENE.GILI01018457.1~~GILI01018457.1.p1  ORF type:complete len:941 (+),score=118.60 GILI01018457.1:86-2824(+)